MMPIYSWFTSVSFCKLLNDCYQQMVTTAWLQLRNNSFRQLLYIPLRIAEQLHQLKVDVLRLFNNWCSTTVYQQLLDYSYWQLINDRNQQLLTALDCQYWTPDNLQLLNHTHWNSKPTWWQFLQADNGKFLKAAELRILTLLLWQLTVLNYSCQQLINCALFKAAAIDSCCAQLQLLISDSCQHLPSTICQYWQLTAMLATNSCLITVAQSQLPAAALLMAAAFTFVK